jgi:Flp pilus assembly pilin Flp
MKLKNFFPKNFLTELWSDQRGQSTTEYILILSVVVMIAIKFKKSFGDKIDGIVGKLGNDIDQNISN